MTQTATDAAALLWEHWRESTQIAKLPSECRPRDRDEGYAIQSELVRLSGQRVAGWKIAATSAAGQRHIGVDGPMAGRLLSGRRLDVDAPISLRGNVMNVAEAEFAFRMARELPLGDAPFSVDEVLDAVLSLHPAIEIPDSRFRNVVRAGAPQLIADNACACWFVIGAATTVDWRARDLVEHRVLAYRNGIAAGEGLGRNVLGDPRGALTWLANELRTLGEVLRADDVVMTGTCIVPVPIAPGDRVRADFGEFGAVEVALSSASQPWARLNRVASPPARRVASRERNRG